MNICGAVLTDSIGTSVMCEGAPGHRDDHKRGFLRWANDGYWYAKHYHPRFHGDIAVRCPLCRDQVYDLPEHRESCAETGT